MPTINQLPVLNTISSGDQLPVYSPNNGDARRTSIGSLLTYFQQTFASPTLSTNLYVPTTGFNITVPTPVSNDQWMLLQPAGTLATGTITLPLNTGVPDGTTVLITTTQQITLLTLALNGASAIYGGVTSLAAGTATAIRFYQATNSWYQLNSETVYGAGVQSFLATPSSANLAAAVTDETGTGSLVFATGPTMTLTNATGLPIATGVSGLGANVATFLATPSSANLAAAVTDETGTGNLVFSISPTFTGTVSAADVTTTGNTILGNASTDTLNIGAGGLAKDGFNRVSIVSVGNGYTPLSVSVGALFNSMFGAPSTGLSAAAYGGANIADTAIYVGKDNTTSRSINAGGTLNASGADYAEYMTKASDFVLAKGDVVGIDANGKLTNVFADAISFVVKSTDPSYVGGDTWGSAEAIGLTVPKQPVRDDNDTDKTFADKETQYTADKAVFDEALQAARQLVDRIAFAGQVPVNVLGAAAGQYIIPVNDSGAIKGEAVTIPTFEQYQRAVGKVIAIEADGRARIIVKVA